jgi:hypothetical protein
MRVWSGSGVFQWESTRTWSLAASGGPSASEFVRTTGALCIPGGFGGISVFFRRASATTDQMKLRIWTAPLFYKPLDEDITVTNAVQYLYELTLDPAIGLNMSSFGTGPRVFAARIKPDQPVGTLLYWQMENLVAAPHSVMGDILLVPNHIGTMTFPGFARTTDAMTGNGAANLIGGGSRLRQG